MEMAVHREARRLLDRLELVDESDANTSGSVYEFRHRSTAVNNAAKTHAMAMNIAPAANPFIWFTASRGLSASSFMKRMRRTSDLEQV
jgi:hypothetical protein